MRLFTIGLVLSVIVAPPVFANEMVTVESPLGDVTVSCLTAEAGDYPFQGLKDNTFVDKKRGFVISRPDEKGWEIVESPSIPGRQNLEIPVLILSTEMSDGFRVNVNVLVEPVPKGVKMGQYLEASVFQVDGSGKNVVTSRVDDKTSGGYLEFYGREQKRPLHWVQRFAVREGNMFIVTATFIPAEKTSPELRKALLDVINSFKLLK
jgi:hypothetical protein